MVNKKFLFTLALFLTSTLGARDLTNYVRWDDVAGARVLLEGNPKLATTMFPCGYPLNYAQSAEMVDLLVEFGAKINAMSKGRAPLHKAIAGHHNEAARRLLELGADVEIHDTENYIRPIHSAAGSGNFEALKMLVEAGADVEVKNFGGHTPLSKAILNASLNCVSYLIEQGADVQATTNSGKSMFEWALEKYAWAKGFLTNIDKEIALKKSGTEPVPESYYKAKADAERVDSQIKPIINLLEEKMGRPPTNFAPEAPPSAPVATPIPEPTPPEPPSLKPSLTPPPPPNKSRSSYWPYAAVAAAVVIAQRKGFFSWLRQKLSSTKPLTPQEQKRLLNELNKLSDQFERQEMSYDAHQKAQRKLLAHLSTQERTALMAAYAACQLEASKEVSW